MFPPVPTKDPAAVQAVVSLIYRRMFPSGQVDFVSQAFKWAVDCFRGAYQDYQPIDARYHDLEHTMQGTLCMMRLLGARHEAGAEPVLSERMFQLGLVAILLHDTGYLKKRYDREGTGAKYTVTHVSRSAEFAAALLAEKGFTPREVRAVQNMIHCTGLDSHVDRIEFGGESEKVCGCALATADLLGQMAAEDYVDKLPILYSEFAEAARFSGGKEEFVSSFASAEDLMRKTPLFWDKIVIPKLNSDFQGLHRFLNDPFPGGENDYFHRIQVNMGRLRNDAMVTS